MKINMAEGDYFNIGEFVSCTTCHGQKIQGEVTSFDHGLKLLALKCQGSKPGHYDIHLLNLGLVEDVQVIREATEQPTPVTHLNTAKLASRLRQSVEEKRRQVNYIGVGVTPQAQSLFHAITKTIEDVRWDGQTIVVMDQVTISPPYGIENCRGRDNRDNSSKALGHVKKVVEKYHRDAERESSRERDRESSTSS